MKFKKSTDLILMGFLFLLLIPAVAMAAVESTMENLDIKGYDTVAYFTTDTAIKVNKSINFQWHDMIWCFTTK